MKILKALAGPMLALGLAACSEAPPEATDTVASDAKIAARSLAVNSSPGKPSVPVSLSYDFDTAPAVGQPLKIRLEITGDDRVEAAKLTLGTRGALALSGNLSSVIALKSLSTAGGAAQAQDIVVTPSDTGRSYVSVQINGTWQGQPFTKAMTIPVQVGEGGPTLQTNGTLIDDGTEVLSSMPADQVLESAESN